MAVKLPFHEWLIVLLISSILLLLIFIAYLREEPALPPAESIHELVDSTLYVKVEGAVAYPGVYQFKQGACLKEALNPTLTPISLPLN